jgi:molybdopterin synthase sulfur carrier subunit
MKIIYRAWLRDQVGCAEEEITLPPEVSTVGLLIDWLSARGPRYEKAFEFIETSTVSVNQVCVGNDAPIGDGDEVIFTPPVAGG